MRPWLHLKRGGLLQGRTGLLYEARDGAYSLEMAHTMMAKKENTNGLEDAVKCMNILDKAEEDAEMSGNGCNTNPLRPNARVVVRGFEDDVLGEHLNGTPGVLQHFHEDMQKWRVTFENGRGHAFIDPVNLKMAEYEDDENLF